MAMAALIDISRKPQDYVQDLFEEFSDLKPEIAKTERSRRLRRNKDGSFIVTEIVVRVYLGTEKSMIVRTIEETTEIKGASEPGERTTLVKIHTLTKKYSREGEPEWSREDEENYPNAEELEKSESSSVADDQRNSDSYGYDTKSRFREEPRYEFEPEPEVPSYQEATYSASHSSSSSASDNQEVDVRNHDSFYSKTSEVEPQHYLANDRNIDVQKESGVRNHDSFYSEPQEVEPRLDLANDRNTEFDEEFRSHMNRNYGSNAPGYSRTHYYSTVSTEPRSFPGGNVAFSTTTRTDISSRPTQVRAMRERRNINWRR